MGSSNISYGRSLRDRPGVYARSRLFEAGANLPARKERIAKSDAPSVTTIALADDHAMFREALRLVLDSEACFRIVGEATTIDEALSLVQKREPDILLLDLKMPIGGGLALLHRLKLSGFRTKVIILTGWQDERELIQAMKLGSCGIVLKGAPSSSLVEAIQRVQNGEIYLDQQRASAFIQQFRSLPEPEPQANEDVNLTFREREIVYCVTQGLRNKEIAAKLFLAEQTVKNYLRKIFHKVGVADRLELALYAAGHNLRETGTERAPEQTGRKQGMQEPHGEGVANHADLESCAAAAKLSVKR